MQPSFNMNEVWYGGYYELAMQYDARSDSLLETALHVLWQTPGLEGCYLVADEEQPRQQRVVPEVSTLLAGQHLRGIALLSNGSRAPCGTCLVREDGGSDWLDFYLPLGGLANAYP